MVALGLVVGLAFACGGPAPASEVESAASTSGDEPEAQVGREDESMVAPSGPTRRFPSEVAHENVSVERASGYAHPEGLTFVVESQEFTSPTTLRIDGALINESGRALEVIVLPVGGHGLLLTVLEDERVHLRPSPQLSPPVPPMPVAFTIPARSRILFTTQVDFTRYEWTGQPTVQLAWSFNLWSNTGEGPRGTLSAELPAAAAPAPQGPPPAGGCSTHEECAGCPVREPIRTARDCECNGCAFAPMTHDECNRRLERWGRLCRERLRGTCPPVSCAQPMAVSCDPDTRMCVHGPARPTRR